MSGITPGQDGPGAWTILAWGRLSLGATCHRDPTTPPLRSDSTASPRGTPLLRPSQGHNQCALPGISTHEMSSVRPQPMFSRASSSCSGKREAEEKQAGTDLARNEAEVVAEVVTCYRVDPHSVPAQSKRFGRSEHIGRQGTTSAG